MRDIATLTPAEKATVIAHANTLRELGVDANDAIRQALLALDTTAPSAPAQATAPAITTTTEPTTTKPPTTTLYVVDAKGKRYTTLEPHTFKKGSVGWMGASFTVDGLESRYINITTK